MVCTIGTNVIACGPPSGVYTGREQDCPECESRHRFIVRWDGAWYGTSLYGACGDSWQDGYRGQRPFARYWRRDAQERFERMWKYAAPRDLFDAYVNADIEFATADGDAWEKACADRDSAHLAIQKHAAEKDA